MNTGPNNTKARSLRAMLDTKGANSEGSSAVACTRLTVFHA